MKIRKIEHVAIAVRDNGALKALLGEAFGLPLEYEEEHPGAVLSFYPVGATYLELLEPRIQATAANSMVGPWIEQHGEGLYHLCLEVDDIDAAVAELRGKGLAFLQDAPVSAHGGTRVIFLNPRDTAGVLFELVEVPAAPDGSQVHSPSNATTEKTP